MRALHWMGVEFVLYTCDRACRSAQIHPMYSTVCCADIQWQRHPPCDVAGLACGTLHKAHGLANVFTKALKDKETRVQARRLRMFGLSHHCVPSHVTTPNNRKSALLQKCHPLSETQASSCECWLRATQRHQVRGRLPAVEKLRYTKPVCRRDSVTCHSCFWLLLANLHSCQHAGWLSASSLSIAIL